MDIFEEHYSAFHSVTQVLLLALISNTKKTYRKTKTYTEGRIIIKKK